MKINILTLFPDMFSVLSHSISGRAIKTGAVELNIVNIRDFSNDNYQTVDDAPYGGGAGQVMKPDVLGRAIESLDYNAGPVFYLSPRGRRFVQETAHEFAALSGMTFICGHYEGVDERVLEYYNAREISLGDFVLSGGELALLPIIDSVARLLPGVLGSDASLHEESFSEALGGGFEYPQYTRPIEWNGLRVPEVLVCGNHALVRKWRMSKVKKAE